MIDETWYQGHQIYEFEILGLKLKPFTFGHYVLLNMIESPFVCGGKKLELSDLLVSVYLCSLDYKEARISDLASSKLNMAILRAGKQIKRYESFKECIDTFSNYIKCHFMVPGYRSKMKGAGSSGAPNWLSVSISLQKELNRTEEQIMNTVCGKVFVDYHILREIEGSISLTSSEEKSAYADIQNAYKQQKKDNPYNGRFNLNGLH